MRLDGSKTLPQGYQAMMALQQVVNESSIEHKLLELVKIRASQINGCAYCLDMHTKDAVAIGENPQRLHVVAAWREAPFYSDREPAALAWCESLTKVSETGAPDEVYDALTKVFSSREVMELTFAIVTINSWNRLAVGLRTEAGTYVSRLKPLEKAVM